MNVASIDFTSQQEKFEFKQVVTIYVQATDDIFFINGSLMLEKCPNTPDGAAPVSTSQDETSFVVVSPTGPLIVSFMCTAILSREVEILNRLLSSGTIRSTAIRPYTGRPPLALGCRVSRTTSSIDHDIHRGRCVCGRYHTTGRSPHRLSHSLRTGLHGPDILPLGRRTRGVLLHPRIRHANLGSRHSAPGPAHFYAVLMSQEFTARHEKYPLRAEGEVHEPPCAHQTSLPIGGDQSDGMPRQSSTVTTPLSPTLPRHRSQARIYIYIDDDSNDWGRKPPTQCQC